MNDRYIDEWEDYIEDTETGEQFQCNSYTKPEIIDRLNKQDNQIKELNNENQQLKGALLFFMDVSNAECSSNWEKSMEEDCQKIFNCSYKEAKEKYGDFDSTLWEFK